MPERHNLNTVDSDGNTEDEGDDYTQDDGNVDSDGNWTSEGDQSKAFRKNFAGIRYTYDAGRDAFIGPRPSNSFVLDEATCTWEAPVAFPTVTEKDGLMYIIEWDDSNDRWVGTVGGGNPQRWNPETSEWIEI